MADSPRQRRLRSDFRIMEKLQAESSVLDFKSRGNPADHYVLTFHGRGLWRPEGSMSVELRDEHVVRVQLGSSYPRMMPELTWQTPMFHPNISASGHVCLGGYGTYWVPSVQLDELCHMLWDMIRYANYDINSPYNRESAQWLKSQSTYRFPLDPRPLRDRVAIELEQTQQQEMWQVVKSANNSQRQMQRIAAQSLAGSTPVIPLPSNDVTFLGEVIEGELVEDELVTADDGITFLT